MTQNGHWSLIDHIITRPGHDPLHKHHTSSAQTQPLKPPPAHCGPMMRPHQLRSICAQRLSANTPLKCWSPRQRSVPHRVATVHKEHSIALMSVCPSGDHSSLPPKPQPINSTTQPGRKRHFQPHRPCSTTNPDRSWPWLGNSSSSQQIQSTQSNSIQSVNSINHPTCRSHADPPYLRDPWRAILAPFTRSDKKSNGSRAIGAGGNG